MESLECLKLRGFYENELKQNILGYWLPRCLDQTFGGFLNCYNNYGDRLVSYDKYAWSQGRFVWLFARLAATAAPLFTRNERQRFLSLAAQGAAFLMKYLGLEREELAAFGDGDNDTGLLKYAGIGFAVANASAACLAAADEIVASNDENGVAQGIERIL